MLFPQNDKKFTYDLLAFNWRFQDVRARQQRKYNRLLEKNERSQPNNTTFQANRDAIDLSGTQLKKWVVNLSRYKLTNAQEKALSHGLNFAISPDNVHDPTIVNDCIIACEKACWKLSPGEASQLRSEIVGAIKSAKVPKSMC